MNPLQTPRLAFSAAIVGYGGAPIVRGVDLEVAAGSFVGLVGPNGAGKSTLLRSVTGAADLLSGSVTLDGESVARMSAKERARSVGVVPQTLPVAFAFDGRSFVQMGRHPWLGRLQDLTDEDHDIVEEVMELTDTARFAHERVDTLSGGDLQRLTVAQALAQRPRVLLLDEPTSHLDLNHRLQVLDLVRRLADDGMAVLAVFHDLDIAARYSDRIAVVSDGEMIPARPPERALEASVIESVFGVKAVVRTDPVTGTLAITPVVRRADVERPTRGRVGVVCGTGTGAVLMRSLALRGVSVAAGALNCGDVDQAVAVTLGADHIDLPAFGEMAPEAELAVRQRYAGCSCVIVAPTPFGRANVGNLRAALQSGVPLILMGEMSAERDFSGGQATSLWEQAVDGGAVRVGTDAEALDAALGLLRDGSEE
ncbi:MAG: ABC transporter ATP-binding protein [Coriobacteriia bacterium]|nr:ABC transporter ATP-binding protein [Coriobacteriia bacterium]MBN2821916.1 ABC transporter ATP-binding protein [Coriobacteriia bacterium]